MKHFKIAAEAGLLDALYEYGKCWIGGFGVEANRKYGLTLLRAAANLGLLSAMYPLAYFFEKNGGKDLKESFH